jgi:hypothetical protein
LNYVEIERGRLFVSEQMHKKEGEMGEGGGEAYHEVIN